MSLPCASCDGGVCTECVLEHQERAGGDQGLSAAEIEVFQLRDENQRLKKAVLTAQFSAAEAQRDRAEMKNRLDAALAQLALLSMEARA
ncbi:MAG: hypothetical protein JNM17_04035 [Archangium sp.]|nr:hypothetical protein [Archangium sp.]